MGRAVRWMDGRGRDRKLGVVLCFGRGAKIMSCRNISCGTPELLPFVAPKMARFVARELPRAPDAKNKDLRRWQTRVFVCTVSQD